MIDWFDLRSSCSPRDSQESSPAPQFKSISALVLSFLYGPTLTSTITSGEIIALNIQTFPGKAMSLLFSMLSRFFKELSSKIRASFFTAAVTISSDFGA